MEKFESERHTPFSVILGFIPRIHIKHFFPVILGFIPRIHAKNSPLLDTRVRLFVTPEYDRNGVDISTPEYGGERGLIKGLDVACQCAALLERLKTHIKINSLFCHPRAWLLTRPEDLDSRVKPENDHNNLRPQCAPDATGFLSDVYKSGTRTRKFLADGVQCGRSMIEMLGVLAIIGVLSVGGIQGFSKAMEMYRWNKALAEWRLLINTLDRYKSQLHINDRTVANSEVSLVPILLAIGDLPEEMKIENNDNSLKDALNNKLSVYSHGTGYIGILSYNAKDNYDACHIILTIGTYYHTMVERVQIYTIGGKIQQGVDFIGDNICKKNSTNCLKDLGVAQISDICKNNQICKGKPNCNYLMYWF